MPHVRQLPSGTWQIAFREAGRTKFRTLGPEVKTKRDADLAARIMSGDLAAAPTVPGTGLRRLHETLDLWLASRREKGRAESTLAGYKHHVDEVKRGFPGNPKLRELAAEELERYLRAREKATSGRTAKKERTTLSCFFGWVVKKKHLRAESNPMLALDWSPREDEDPDERAPCPREVFVDHLLELHREQLRPVVVPRSKRAKGYARDRTEAEVHAIRLYAGVLRVLWATGIRVAHVCRWKPEDVRIEGAPIPAVKVRAPKNKGGKRWIPIPRGLVRLLARWRKRALERGAGVPVFHTHEGAEARNALDKFRQGWLEDPRHEKHRAASFHAFRHGLATRGDEAGLDERVLSRELLGHANREMTERYTHRTLERLRAAQEQLAAFERKGRRARPRA